MSAVSLGTKVKFVDGERGRILGLRRAQINKVVRDQCLVGPDKDDAFLDEDNDWVTDEDPVWIDLESVSILIPLDAPDPVFDLQSKLTDARLALLAREVDDRLGEENQETPTTDLVLHAILDLLPLLRMLPIPAAVTEPLERAAHNVIRSITGDTP